MNPTWENTFNSELKFWGYIGHALTHAQEGGYSFLLWNGRVYEANDGGALTTWYRSDLYRRELTH